MKERLSPKKLTRKEQIVDKAIEYFSKEGTGAPTIDDIVRGLNIGKGTLYRYFQNKKDLIIHCMRSSANVVLPAEILNELRKETNYHLRMKKRHLAVLRDLPHVTNAISLANQALFGNDPDLISEARELYRTFAKPITNDLQGANRLGLLKDINIDTVALFAVGLGETIGNIMKVDPSLNKEKLLDTGFDLFWKGIELPSIENREVGKLSYWNVCDCDNHTERLHNIAFNEKAYLSGNSGNWELQLPLEQIVSISFSKADDVSAAMVTTQKGKSISLTVDKDTVLSGEADSGKYKIRLGQIGSVQLI